MSSPFMQLYVGDYLRDTRHLSAEQHGAYLLLLMAAWNAGGKLPNDPRKLARLASCTPSRWAKISADVLEFFDVDGNHITNRRLTLELKKASEKAIKRAEAGMRGGYATALKSKGTDAANAIVLPQHSSEPEPEKKLEATPLVRQAPNAAKDDGFERAWKAFPPLGRQRSKSQAKTLPIWREAAKAAGGAERLANAVARYVREDATHKGECGPPAFDRWLRDGRWEHWLPDSNAPNGGGSAMSPELIAARRALLQQAPESPNA
jgi:uncharacterized protein YdaU (DUF1376 family)